MSNRELAYVKDVGIMSGGFGHIPRTLNNGVDLRITESDLTLSPSNEALVLDGFDTKTISFADVKRIELKKDSMNPDWHVLAVSLKGGHWWNKRGVGQIVLRDWQFAQVADALKSVRELGSKLRI